MRMELRVCQHCYDGTHGNDRKTEITRDMVACAEQIREYKDFINLDAVYITKVEDGEPDDAEALSVVIAGIDGDTITLRDTQLVIEDADERILVYPEPADILEVLVRNLDQVDQQTRQNVGVELSPEGDSMRT